MKKVFALALVMVMVLTMGCALSESSQKMVKRTLREGKYIIGEDIDAGKYWVTCIETEGEQIKDAYGALGEAFDAIDGTQGYGSMFGAFGSLMEDYSGMDIEILGSYGDVLKSYTMKTGDSFSIKLEENTALKISSGSCTIELEQ